NISLSVNPIPPIGGGESDQEEEQQNLQATGKVGAKKQRKLEEKQAKRAHREVGQSETGPERWANQRQAQREVGQSETGPERGGPIRIEAQREVGQSETGPDRGGSLFSRQDSKVVLLEDLASHFGMRTQDAIARLQDLLAEGSLTGVIDDRGKFISISPEELSAVARFIQQRGRVSIAELAQASNSLINLTPVLRNQA
uniref:DDRGK domain-containing protein 1 n=1 Tax=Gadus morhua TaxID=8049 RepID=A0A8C4Z2G3_GADMO